MDYAEAINRFNDQVSSLCAKAEEWGLTIEEVVAELRRVATDLEAMKATGSS